MWQDCRCSPEAGAFSGLHNAALYLDPTTSIINPPGTYPPVPLGTTATTNPGHFRWLDGIPSPFAGHYDSWSLPAGSYPPAWPWGGPGLGGAPNVVLHGNWCQNSVPGFGEADILSGTNWDNILPYSVFTGRAFPTGDSMRITLEFERLSNPANGQGTPYHVDRNTNVQTFFIWKQQ